MIVDWFDRQRKNKKNKKIDKELKKNMTELKRKKQINGRFQVSS